MTNVGKNRLVKVIFTNVHKISDACANSFGRYIMIAQCMRNVFTFYYINSGFSGKMVVLRRLKLICPSNPQHYNNCSARTFLILFKKIVSPTHIQRGQRLCILYERLQRRENKVITILYDRFFIYRTAKSQHLKKIKKSYEK